MKKTTMLTILLSAVFALTMTACNSVSADMTESMTAEYNGGTIIINGQQVSEIPQSIMGGGRFGGGMPNDGNFNGHGERGGFGNRMM